MKALKIILIILASLFGLYCLWMLSLSNEFNIQRSVKVKAPKAVVFEQVSDFKNWEAWSPWYSNDSTMTFQYADQTSGTGGSYSWTSENSGNGTQSFLAVHPHDSIRTLLNFEGMDPSNGAWTFERNAEGETEVTWSYHTDLGFFDRSFGVFGESILGPMFEQGLNQLKDVAESKAEDFVAEDGPEESLYEVFDTEFTPVEYYSVQDRVSFEEMGPEFFAERYGELARYVGDDFANMEGHPMAIYHEWDEEERMATVEVALPIRSDKTGNERVKKKNSYSGRALKVNYLGAYEGTGKAHDQIYRYATANDHEMIGAPIEVYVTDPGEEPDTSKWLTEVYYPIASPQ